MTIKPFGRRFLLIVIGTIAMQGCGLLWHPGVIYTGIVGEGTQKNPDVYRIGAHTWVGDSISIQVYRTSDPTARAERPKLTVVCLSCNDIIDPITLSFNSEGVARIYIPEAGQLLSARLHVTGSGIDTTFIQMQRSPESATSYFHLATPLLGRVMIERFAVLYTDTTQDSVVATANVGDEMNIYGSHSAFYLVQHPNFSEPLYLLKKDAFPIE